MSEWHRTKSTSKAKWFIMMVFKTKGLQIRWEFSMYGSLGLSSMLVELQKGMLVDKNLSRGKNNFLKNKMSSNALHSSREMRTDSM